MLALEMFPKKTVQTVEGDRPVARISSHLAIINRFKAWRANLKKQTNYSPFTIEQRDQLRRDFREVIEFCAELTS